MSEQSAPPTSDASQPPTGTNPQQPDTGQQPTDWHAEAQKWQGLARKHETRAKENADKAAAFDDAQESQKTEQQKLTDALAKAQAEAATARSEALRLQVAAAKGVPADLLTGSTQEELDAAADRLLAFRGDQPATPPPFLGQGQRSTPPAQDGNAWLRSLRSGQRATTRIR